MGATDEEKNGSADFLTNTFVPKKLPQYICAVAAAMGAFGLGTVLGWSSPGLYYLQNSTHFENFDKSSEDGSWIASISNLGAMAAGLTLSFPMELIGRRWTMLVLSLPFIAGWLLMGFARNVAMLIVGRFITGYCGGAFSLAYPIYVSETCQPAVRGILVNIMSILLCGGVLFVYVIGAYVAWDVLSFICAAVPCVSFLAIWFIPETPQYLLAHSKETEARSSLKRLRGAQKDEQVEDEMQQMKKNLAELQTHKATFKDILNSSVLKPTLISMTIMFLQQGGGTKSILFYSNAIFEAAETDIGNDLQSIIVGIAQLSAVCISTTFVDRVDRKILLIGSQLGMATCQAALGTYFYLKEHENSADGIGWLPLVSVASFISIYNFGIGPLCWTMMGELTPSHVKSITGGFAICVSWGMAFLITKFFSSMVESDLHTYGSYWLFGSISVTGSIFVFLFVPETRGRNLADIQRSFK